MAKPSEKQIKELEKDHKEQYLNLITANRLWLKLFAKIKGLPKTDPKYKAVFALGNSIARNGGKWYARQWKFEQKAKVPPVSRDIMKYFLSVKDEPKLLAVGKQYVGSDIKLDGMGFIPLLIWGVIILITAFTAYEITDELTTTAEEKADLMKQTQTTLKELNVTGPEAAAIITSTQAQASEKSGGFLDGIMLKLAIGAGAYFLITNKSK